MSEPFLILHKVRGEPAFDIATQMECPICQGQTYKAPSYGDDSESLEQGCDECNHDGFWWIIPTSGHRAYPVLLIKLEDLYYDSMRSPHIIDPLPLEQLFAECSIHDLPDHYPSKSSPPPTSLSTIMSTILSTITPKLRR